MDFFTIVTEYGELIARGVSRSDIDRLRGLDENGHQRLNRFSEPVLPLVQRHRKRRDIWFALVAPEVIRAELRRDVQKTRPTAESNCTTRVVEWSSGRKAGRYVEHNDRKCQAYPTHADTVNEHVLRLAKRLGDAEGRRFLCQRRPEWDKHSALDLLANGEGLIVLQKLQTLLRQMNEEAVPASLPPAIASAFPLKSR